MIFDNQKVILWVRIVLLTAAIVVPFLLYSAVLATISQPDSTPSISNMRVNRNLITSGDICFYGEYRLPYASLPTEPADEAFIFRLMNTDNSSELGAILPYVYFDSGYNLGIFSFYFSSASASNITWQESYIIRISEQPAQFASPVSFDTVLPVTAYTSATTQEANQTDMAVQIIAMARDMGEEYTDMEFLEQSATGTILSVPTGANYFRWAIRGLDSMAPALFLVQDVTPDIPTENWTTAQADNYTGRFSGTWVGTSENATATQFGITTPMLLGMIAILPACLGAIFISQRRFHKTEPGLIASILVIIMGFCMGWIPAAIFATIFQICGIYIAYLFFFSRAS